MGQGEKITLIAPKGSPASCRKHNPKSQSLSRGCWGRFWGGWTWSGMRGVSSPLLLWLRIRKVWQKRKCGVKYGCLTISHSTVREAGGPSSPCSPRGAAGTYRPAQTPQGYPAVRPELQNPFFAIPCWVLPQNPPVSVSPALWGRDLGCRAFPRAPHSCPEQQSKLPAWGVPSRGSLAPRVCCVPVGWGL